LADVLVPIFGVFKRLTILLTGLTGSGKTTQIGLFASRLRQETGLLTRLYTGDYGGLDSILPIVDAGTIQVCAHSDTPDMDPFLWSERAARGMVVKDRTWVSGLDPKIGCYAFDSATQIGHKLGQRIRTSHADPTQVGIGAKAFINDIGSGEDALHVASLDKSHYGMVQTRLEDLIKVSQSLPGHLIWTAGMRRLDQDQDTRAPIAGPDLFGKALITAAPSWFKYTFPLVKATQMGSPTRHLLYMVSQSDANFGGAMVLANARIPLGGRDSSPVPQILDPADVVLALELLAKRQQAARAEEMKKVQK